MKLIPLPAFQDNDLWVSHNGRRALVAEPGDAQSVPACLQRDRLQLGAILVTHQHPDRIGGFAAGVQTGAAGKAGGAADLIRYSQRCKQRRRGAVAQAARAHASATPPDDVAVFACLRPWNNGFK